MSKLEGSANSYRLSRYCAVRTVEPFANTVLVKEASMKTRIAPLSFPTAIALFAAMTGMPAQAGAADAIDACVQRFIAGHLADHEGKITINKEVDAVRPLALSSGRQMVQVKAATKSGAPLMHATCVVNERGVVLSMRPAARTAPMLAQKLDKKTAVAKSGDAT
jgi:hypothetical protein